MKPRLMSIAPLAVMGLALSSSNASAGRIPIIYGYGDTFSRVADLPADHPARHRLSGDAALGWKYGRFHIYYCDLWTHSGEYVIYEGTNYFPLGTDPDKAAIAAGVPRSLFGKPILYTIPLGWIILVGLVAACFVWDAFSKYFSDARKAERLLKIPDYQEAVRLLEGDLEQTFPRGVEYLVGRGCPRDLAEKNLLLIVNSRMPSTLDPSPETTGQAAADPEPGGVG